MYYTRVGIGCNPRTLWNGVPNIRSSRFILVSGRVLISKTPDVVTILVIKIIKVKQQIYIVIVYIKLINIVFFITISV